MTREEAIAVLESDVEYMYSQDSPYNRGTYLMAIEALKAEPTKHGRWETPKGYPNVLLCSECNTPYEKKEFVATPNYCPNCGAKMDESEWEEPEINPCRGCRDYDGKGGCISNGGCGRGEVEE